MKKLLALLFAANTAVAGISGSIGHIDPNTALIYGTEIQGGNSVLLEAPSSAFCGISELGTLTRFVWTGFGKRLVFTAPYSGIWAVSCFNPYSASNAVIYSVPYFSRKAAETLTQGDSGLTDELRDILGDTK